MHASVKTKPAFFILSLILVCLGNPRWWPNCDRNMIFSEANRVIVAFSRIYFFHSQKFFLLLFHSSFGYLTLPYSDALVTFRLSPLGLQPSLSKGSDQLGQIERITVKVLFILPKL